MLTRFTPAIRALVGRAYEQAVREGSPEIGETHLFEALLEDEKGVVLLEAVAGDQVRERVVAEIKRARRTGGLTAAETDALAGLGVDVGALVGRIEGQLGTDALARPETGPRSRSQRVVLSGTVLRAFDEGERQVGMAGGGSMGVEHLALGIVSTPSLLSESLARRGVTVETVGEMVEVERRRGARR